MFDITARWSAYYRYNCKLFLVHQNGGLGQLHYPLLADFNKVISRDYGVLVEEAGLALRGLFIIDPNGIVRQITINDLPVGRSVDETLRLVKAFQFVEANGEGIPYILLDINRITRVQFP